MGVIWETVDRLGRPVELTDAGWAHILDRHEDMVEFQQEIHVAIALADEVCSDTLYRRRAVHYLRPSGARLPIRVVVGYRPPPTGWAGEVISAFRSERKAKGEKTRWPYDPLVRTHTTDERWKRPVWPERLPAASRMRAVYGPVADEFTIRFPDTPNRDIVVVWLATDDLDYAALMVHEHTGDVVGVQVDSLADFAASRHPEWEPATRANPDPAVVGRIVADVRQLHDRVGTEPPLADNE